MATMGGLRGGAGPLSAGVNNITTPPDSHLPPNMALHHTTTGKQIKTVFTLRQTLGLFSDNVTVTRAPNFGGFVYFISKRYVSHADLQVFSLG